MSITTEMLIAQEEKQKEAIVRVIWNEAIETALDECRKRDTFESWLLHSRIKELKK